MNVTAGPVIQKYATVYDISVQEVVDWVNAYINLPGEFPALIAAGVIEPAEKDRAQSIMEYIKREVQ